MNNGQDIYDVGAYPEDPISGKITNRVDTPWAMPEDAEEEAAVNKMQEMMETLKQKRQS